ncbi:MAG TPA: ABC transporter permease [Vicinamibacterales bacterium]|nr:ABC transporter permease [Vicinamibacterales bacterium]
MDGFLRDFRFAVRNMGRNPGLLAVVALSLGLGIGANTAIFTLLRAVVLRNLPVREPDRLVLFHWGAETWPGGLDQSGAGGPRQTPWRVSSRSLPFPFFRELAGHTSLFSAVFAFAPLGPSRQNITLAAGGSGERVDGEMVSGGFFSGLGVSAVAGRLITDADERDGAHVAVLGHEYWVRRFGADPGIVGASVTINSLPFTIVGVAPAGFFGVQPGRRPDVWVSMIDRAELAPWGFRPLDVASLFTVRDYWWAHVMARLRDDVDERQAQAVLDGAFQRFVADALPEVDRERPPHLGMEWAAGGLDLVRDDYERPLYILMGMVALVLLIACANVAVLLLARATTRRREFALRVSLGAPRARVVRQLITESLVLAAGGALLGLLCAGWTSRALMVLLPPKERPLVDVGPDPTVLVFTAGVAIAAAFLFGIVPALVGTRVDLLPALKQASSGTLAADRPGHRVWSAAFVIIQVALSLVLLMGAALFVRTLSNLHRQTLGLEPERFLVFGLDPTQNGYSGDRIVALYREILVRLQGLPGVESASAMRHRLFSGWVSSGAISVAGEPPNPAGTTLLSNGVGPGFARTLGLRVLAGRDLTWEDVGAGRRVALVNEAMAQHFFAGDAIGRSFNYGDKPDPSREYEIVGIVSNAKYSQVRGRDPRTAYVPYSANRATLKDLHIVLRTASSPLALVPSVRAAMHAIEPNVALVELDSLSNHMADSLWQEGLFARLATAFGALALTLACVGLYGTISYGVSRRRTEVAVRVALGARRGQILWMFLRQAVLLAAAGVAAGVPLTLWTSTFASSLLFNLAPRDPATLAVSAGILIGVASLAGYLPSRRATLIEPAAALKQE